MCVCVRESARPRETEREQVSSEQKRKDPKVFRCTGERRSRWPSRTSRRQPGLHSSRGVAPAGAERPGRTALLPPPP